MYKISSYLQSSFGRVKIDLIPNVSEFNTFIESYSEFAAIFGLKSPNRKNTLQQFKELRKANKYIVRQSYRAMRYAQQGRMAEHDYLCNVILNKSDAFLVAHYHRKFNHWYMRPWSKVVSVLNKVRRIAKGDVPLEFKRVWINKKLNDFARGLGVPEMEWRIYPSMLNRIIEHTLVAKNMLSNWQHGGRAFKGTHTAWETTMNILRDQPFIYEFDIKGFYDNIITKNIAPFLGDGMSRIIQTIVDQTKPTKYILPPLDHDLAVKTQNNLISVTESILDDLEELMSLPLEEGETDPAEILFALLQNEGDSPEVVLTKLMEELNGFIDAEVPLEKVYEMQMRGNPRPSLLDYLELETFTEQDRARGRDAWKNLGQRGRGFPQGLGISPILSTNALERALPKDQKHLLMYMDDGLIYGHTRKEVEQTIEKLNVALTQLGITLAPEKSGWIREDWSFTRSSKFLAIRINKDGTLVSETRNGTSRPFPNPLGREEYLEFAETLEIVPSTARITYDDIYMPLGKEKVIWLGGVMGNILNYMYAPESSRDAQEWRIMEGRMKSMLKILRTRHLTLQKIEKYFPEPITRPGLGEKLEAVRLSSVSSIAAIRLLRYMRGRKNRRVRA